MPIIHIFNILLVNPITNLLLLVYHLLLLAHIPFALGFSIIILTALIRLILYPLTASQLRSSKKMQDINPHLKKLKEKHKGDSKMLQAETMKLYKEHGVNPVAGCLPLIIQLPFIWSLYSVLSSIVKMDPKNLVSYMNSIAYSDFLKLNKVWDTSFFGLPIDRSPSQLITVIGVFIVLIPAMTALLQFIQSKMLFPTNTSPKEKKGEKKSEDFAQSFQTQSAYIFPVMIGVLSFNFPLGLSLYWNTFTIFGIIQQYQIQGWGSLDPLVKKIWTKKSKTK